MTIKETIEQYLDYHMGIGEKYRTNAFILKAFGVSVGNDTDIKDITIDQCSNYLNGKGQIAGHVTSYWFCIHRAIKGLFEWCILRGYADSIPLPHALPNKPDCFIPYIYSKEELSNIFECALHYRKRFNIFYPEVIQYMLKTIYFLGLRPSEAVRLTISDIHLQDGNYALIRDSKFYKSRITPFNKQVSAMFSSFFRWRIKVGMTTDTSTPLFLDKRGNGVTLPGLQQAFRLICAAACIKRDTTLSHSDVRLQDLRHTFATNRVLEWYKQGKNVQDMLPLLSAYLGHENLDSTAVYISFIPELIAEAGDKFYRYYQKGGTENDQR